MGGLVNDNCHSVKAAIAFRQNWIVLKYPNILYLLSIYSNVRIIIDVQLIKKLGNFPAELPQICQYAATNGTMH